MGHTDESMTQEQRTDAPDADEACGVDGCSRADHAIAGRAIPGVACGTDAAGGEE